MRPFISHADQGVEAYLNGKTEADNPYREDTVAHIEWLKGHVFQKVDSGDLNEDDHDCARVYHDDIVHEARRTASRLQLDLPAASVVAEAIGMPVESWRGNCFAVSVATLESGVLDEFQEKHGSLFPAYGIPAQRCGYSLVKTHLVGSTTCPSMLRSTTMTLRECGYGRSIVRTLMPRLPEASGPSYLGDREVSRTGMITPNRLHWLLNSPLEKLGTDADMFVKTADRLQRGVFVPIDTRLWLEFSQNGYDQARIRESHTEVPETPKARSRPTAFSPI